MNYCYEVDSLKHVKSITEGELWDIMETMRGNVKIIRVTDEVLKHEKTEYSSRSFDEGMDGENMNDWILVTISSIGK